MATRSLIGRLNDNDTIDAIYCHFDGYLEGVGEELNKNYTQKDKVNELIELGDISKLGSNTDNTEAYSRDKGEELNIRHFTNEEEYARNIAAEYIYLFKDNQWYYTRSGRNDFKPIENKEDKYEIDDEPGELLESYLKEGGLSRLYKHMSEHDVACISANQYLPNRADYDNQQEYDKEFKDRLGKQKKLDDEALRIALSGEGYGVIRIKGFYQYNSSSVPSKENSYLVVNRNDDEYFLDKVLNIARQAKQNSIYYVPKNTFEGSWYYTGVDLSKPGNIDDKHKFGDVEYRGPVHLGTYSTNDDGTGYSLINGRPFASYTDGMIKKDVEKVKVKNTHNNITVIDESICEPCTLNITKEMGNYLKKVENYLS